jgi:hypothetical protein
VLRTRFRCTATQLFLPADELAHTSPTTFHTVQVPHINAKDAIEGMRTSSSAAIQCQEDRRFPSMHTSVMYGAFEAGETLCSNRDQSDPA